MPGVLVVEDEGDIRDDVAEVLRDEGYLVSTAANGQEALEHLQGGERPCLILLDLMMPQMDGFEFRAKQVADDALASIPVVLVSGANNVQQRAADMNVGGYLLKPFRLNDLLTTVARYCR